MKIMFLGTSSNAGKTLTAAAFCRYLSSNGYDAVPFKGSNLSLNSYVTEDGKEIGMGQAFQAWASDKEPSADMNPILLKPSDNGIQTVMNGHLYGNPQKKYPSIEEKRDAVRDSFDRLSEEHDAVVCEGSGSPVELNIMENDVANLFIVNERRIPSVIVGDIEKGGVFAAVYGTWELIPEEYRRFVKGFIINRFRGEPAILKNGIDTVEKLTGMRCLGVVPYVNLKFPAEDSMSSTEGKLNGNDIKKAYLENLDGFIDASKDSLDYGSLVKIASDLIE